LLALCCFSSPFSQYADPAAAQSDPTASMYDPTRVISIALNMDADHWNQLRAQERIFVSLFGGDCLAQPFDNPFSWFPAQVTIDGQLRNNIGARKKGFLGRDCTTTMSGYDFGKGQELWRTASVEIASSSRAPSVSQ
jgi:spore coat protein CotH